MLKIRLLILIITQSFLIANVLASNIKILDKSSAPDDVIFFDGENKKYSLDQFEGKTILLVFWATWCAGCVKEIPDLDILQKDFRKLPFKIVTISEDYQGVDVVKQYFKQYEIRYLDIYHDYTNQLFKSMSITGLPTSILIDADGKMIMSFTGNVNWYDEEIRKLILSNIPGNNIPPKNSYNDRSSSNITSKNTNVKKPGVLDVDEANKAEPSAPNIVDESKVTEATTQAIPIIFDQLRKKEITITPTFNKN